jgi:hypothetical protein
MHVAITYVSKQVPLKDSEKYGDELKGQCGNGK